MKGTPLNYCQGVSDNVSQTRLADFLIPGVPGPSPRCGAVAGDPLAAAVLTGILPSDELSRPASVLLGLPAPSSRCQRHSEALSDGRLCGSPSVFTQTPSALEKWEVNCLIRSLCVGMADVPYIVDPG